jgi:subtilase family serine protease
MNWLIANQPHIVTADSMHMIFGGTSAAAPIVAGFAALYFEAFPNASNEQLKQDIINCSKTDQYTGSVPNYRWGNGKLDAYGAITCSWPQTVGLSTQQSNQLFAYPIPFQNIIHIPIKNPMNGLLQVSDISGRIVYKQNINTKSNEELSINLSELSSGIYLLIMNGTIESYRQLVIKE